jgi:anti-anti-sigma factor
MAARPTAEPSQFSVQDVVSERHHRLLLSGELDMRGAATLEACLHQVSASGATSLVMDLSQLTFMDSTGVRMTLLARQLCAQHECEFLLIQGPAQIQLVFEVTGLLNQLPFQHHHSPRK